MSRLKVFFVPTNVSGVVFYRAWQPYLSLKGSKLIEPMIWWYKPNQYTLHPWEGQLKDPTIGPTIVRDLDRGCAWADVVVFMGLHSFESLNLFRKLKTVHDKKFLMEVDDYLFSIPQKNAAHDYYKPGMELTRVGLEQMKISDGVICSTPYLAELYKSFNDKIYVAQNVIHLAPWRTREAPHRRGVTIGWVGGGTHEEDLRIVKDPLFRVLEKHKKVKANILHGIPKFLRNHKKIKFSTSFKPVDKYPKWVVKNKFDIGIAPLEDNNFNRGKSNLRWLEYSAMGIPTIASPLPHFTQSIRHGVTGFIANTPEEWEKYLDLLINDRDLRVSMGERAKEEVKQNWGLKNLRFAYENLIKELFNAEPNKSGSGDVDRAIHTGPESHGVHGSGETSEDPRSARAVCS